MRTIYADEVFLLNAIIDYFVLLATAKICALPLKRLRFGISAIVGGAYASLTLFSFAEFLSHPIFKPTVGLLMVLIAFGGEKRLFRSYIAFIATSALFAGAVFAISLFVDDNYLYGTHVQTPLRVLALSFGISYLVLTTIFNRFTESRKLELSQITLAVDGKNIEFKALNDNGNGLFDPISGLPVMIIGKDISKQFLCTKCYDALLKNPAEFLMEISEDSSISLHFHLIPFSTVGVEASMIPVFHPDKLSINGRENKSTLVGLSPTNLCNSNNFSAII